MNQPPNNRPYISAIITSYYEEKSIDEFYSRLSKGLKSTGKPYEIIFVNDGSTDRTFEKIKEIYNQNDDVTCCIDLIKNCGQDAAATAGIEMAKGQHLLFIDSDLQLDPEQVDMFVEKMEQGALFVNGVRRQRNDTIYRQCVSKLANFILSTLTSVKITDIGCTFRLIDRRIIDACNFGPLKELNYLEIQQNVAEVVEVVVNHHPRKHGSSGMKFQVLFNYAIDHVMHSSPYLFQKIALLLFALGLLAILRLSIAFVYSGSILNEVTNGMILNTLLIVGFFELSLLLLIGEYCIRTFNVSKEQRIYIVKEVLN